MSETSTYTGLSVSMAIVVIMTAVVAVPAASAEAPAPEVRACVDAEDSRAEVGNTCEDGAGVLRRCYGSWSGGSPLN
jgi:hypothetical protein